MYACPYSGDGYLVHLTQFWQELAHGCILGFLGLHQQEMEGRTTQKNANHLKYKSTTSKHLWGFNHPRTSVTLSSRWAEFKVTLGWWLWRVVVSRCIQYIGRSSSFRNWESPSQTKPYFMEWLRVLDRADLKDNLNSKRFENSVPCLVPWWYNPFPPILKAPHSMVP